jgi:hypothetical protein
VARQLSASSRAASNLGLDAVDELAASASAVTIRLTWSSAWPADVSMTIRGRLAAGRSAASHTARVARRDLCRTPAQRQPGLIASLLIAAIVGLIPRRTATC